jgi:hypothetical protein
MLSKWEEKRLSKQAVGWMMVVQAVAAIEQQSKRLH